jgi:protein SCO1
MQLERNGSTAPQGRREWLKWAGGAGLATALGSSAAAAAPAPAPRGPLTPAIPNVPVLTHEGKTLRFYDDLVRGRIVVINMMYTVCTGICPVSTANLLQVQEALGPRLGRDVFMLSMTLQPQFDDPAALRDYMKRYGVQPRGWTYLTGKPQDMEALRRGLGFFSTDPVEDADLRAHTGMVRAGNERFNRWLMVPAFSSPRRILSAVQRL